MKRTKEASEHTRDQIVNAAKVLFGNRGYSRTTLLDVVKAAGLTRGAMYWHFSSKADLFCQVMESIFVQVNQLSENALNFQGSPVARIEHFLEKMIRMILEHPTYKAMHEILLFQSEWRDELGTVYNIYSQRIMHLEDTLKTLFAEALSAGLLPVTFDQGMAVTSCIAFVGGLRLMKEDFGLDRKQHLDAQKLAHFFTEKLLAPTAVSPVPTG